MISDDDQFCPGADVFHTQIELDITASVDGSAKRNRIQFDNNWSQSNGNNSIKPEGLDNNFMCNKANNNTTDETCHAASLMSIVYFSKKSVGSNGNTKTVPNVGPHMDYREAYGDAHYDNTKLKSYEVQELSTAGVDDLCNSNEISSTSARLKTRKSQPVLTFMGDGSTVHTALEAVAASFDIASKNKSPLQRHRSVPDNCCKTPLAGRCDSLSKLQII